MSVHFPQAVVSYAGQSNKSLPKSSQPGKVLENAAPQSKPLQGDYLTGRLSPVRFGAADSKIDKFQRLQKTLCKPWDWMQQVGFTIRQSYTRLIATVKWAILMVAGLVAFLPVPQAFRRYIEGRFLLGPSKVTALDTQKDAALRARIDKKDFEMDDYQDELRRSGLGFNTKHDKVPLHAWYIAGKANQPCIIYSHGRGTNIGQQEGLLKGFMDRGYGVLIYEYPSQNLGEGVATEQRLYKAGLAASLYARKILKIPVANQVIMGNSMGSVVAAKTVNHLEALGERPKALIMVSTFPTLNEAFISYRNRMGALGKLLNADKLTVKLDARAALRENKHVPVLLLQGALDKSTPYYMAEALKKCIPEENKAAQKVVSMPHCKHKLRETDFPFIVQETDGFLEGLKKS